MTERWLSLRQISEVLDTTRNNVRWLTKHGYLETLPGSEKTGTRYLDPGPKYAERLRISEMLYGRRHPLTIDLSEKALYTKAEIAYLCGVTEKYMALWLFRNKVKSIKCGKHRAGLCVYTPQMVREILWKRSGATQTSRAPLLMPELVAYFLKHQNETAVTDKQFSDDDALMKKMRRILKMKSPQKEAAMKELWAKVELAKQVSPIFDATGASCSDAPNSEQ